jgi:hypothetical protein
MGKRQTKETYGQVKQDQSNAGIVGGNMAAQNDNETRQAGDNLGSRDLVASGYGGLASGGAGNDVSNVNSKIDTSRFDPIYGAYGGLAADGGYSDASKANINGDIGGLRSMGANGGLDASSMSRMRGGNTFDELAQNGGLTMRDRANIKTRALAPISSAMSATRDEMARRRSVQGGFTPGFDASSRALTRDTARNAASTSLDANLGILDRVNAGKLQGAQGMADSEGNMQSLRTGNMYRGLTGAANTEMGMNNSIFGNKATALAGQRGVAGDIAGIDAQNIGNEFANRNIDANNADRNLSATEAGLAGYAGLYGSDLGRYTNALDRGNGINSSNQQTNLGYYGASEPLAMAPGAGSNIAKGIGIAGGIGAGIMTGGASTAIGAAMKSRGGKV